MNEKSEATQRVKRVAVLGLGYVGLPLIRACIRERHKVVGFDVDKNRVENLRKGISHVDDVTNDEVKEWLIQGFHPTSSTEDLSDIDVFIMCVPTPLAKSGGPDLGAIESATSTIESRLSRQPLGVSIPLVVLESTTYPGTTEEIVQPILEKNGLVASIDFNLAFSPERIDPGNKTWTFENTPKVVGGLTMECTDAAEAFYAPLTTKIVRTKGLKEAEMAKLLENTYRHVNIALVNELAKFSHELGIDIWDVIDAAETKPYGFQAFRPGPGVGGHCIPIDPNYLSHRVKTELGQPFRFVELAQEINASMPEYVVSRLRDLLNTQGLSVKGASILILGVSYKANIADQRESPATAVIRILRRMGARVSFLDPFVEEFVVDNESVYGLEAPAASSKFDSAVILQRHSQFSADEIDRLSNCVLDVSTGVTAGEANKWSRL